MAERRMFAKAVIGSARFLRMKTAARLLYFDLGMQADDDGFVEAFAVIRTTGATEKTLRELESSGFVQIVNDDLVTYILDWNRNNLIKKDRYKPSAYKPLLNQLEAERSQSGTQPEPQDSIVKDSIVKDSIGGAEKSADKPPRTRFVPPTLEEVQSYVSERHSNVDPQGFIDFYEAKGWMVGKTPMKDWKAACRNAEAWERWNKGAKDQKEPYKWVAGDNTGSL